ncbi:hypothetical protein B484DRAFT_461797 [Ochromonadaceae sp. CCMP2298]|nr:hypothetical protein B484DRAFT_461797 [Ochromonadaceae sp. CCMP2298]
MSDNSKDPSDDEASHKSASSKEDDNPFDLSETPTQADAEPVKKKRRIFEHHSTAKARELASTMRLQNKVMKMECAGKTADETKTYIKSAVSTMDNHELERLIVHTSLGNVFKMPKSHVHQCDVAREIIRLESAEEDRKKYFDDMAKSTRTGITTEITKQTGDLKRYKISVKKATANLLVLENHLKVGEERMRVEICRTIFQFVCAEKAKRDA